MEKVEGVIGRNQMSSDWRTRSTALVIFRGASFVLDLTFSTCTSLTVVLCSMPDRRA